MMLLKKLSISCCVAAVLCAAAVLCFSGCGNDKIVPKVTVIFSGPEGMTMSYKGKELPGTTRRMYPGVYIFKFSAPGYKALWKKFEIKAGDNNSTENVEMEADISAMLITCYIDGKKGDPGAKVFFNGDEYGATPCLLHNLSYGEHEVMLKHPGYAPKTFKINIVDGRPLPLVRERLSSISGMLQVTGTPHGARLFIDDKYVGNVPFQAKYNAGKYLLELRAPGYVSLKKEVVLHAEKTLRTQIALKPVPSVVEISSTPANAVCIIDGKKYGTTPCRVENLPPGNYKVELRLPGYDAYQEMLEVKPGSHEQLKISMESGYGSARLHIRPAGVNVSIDGKSLGQTQRDPRFANETMPINLKNLSPGRHVCRISHPRAKPRTIKEFSFVVRKNKLTEYPVVEMWVADHRIIFSNGLKLDVKLIRMDELEVEFSEQPGITVTEKRKNVQVQKLEAL